jgi:hypothetical protein
MSLLDKLVPPQADPAEFSPPLIRLQDSPPSPLGRRVIQVSWPGCWRRCCSGPCSGGSTSSPWPRASWCRTAT